MPIHTFIPYLLSVCAIITTKMASKLTDIFFLNSAVTLTLNFQGQMINCLCLKNAGLDLHKTKAMWINWLSYFICDLGHWPCLWPWISSGLWPLAWISKVKSWNCHIYEISFQIAKIKTGEFFGWFDILLIISDLRFSLIVWCSAVHVWRFGRWQHQYNFISIATAIVCI